MKKKYAFILLIVGLLVLTSGVGMFVGFREVESDEMDNVKTSIIDDYEIFKEKVESFSDERTSVYNELNNITYLVDLQTNYQTIISEYTKYENSLKEIESASTDLKVNCTEYTFDEDEINNKVSAFITNYEQAVNYFVKDVETLNNKIDEYNTWVSTSSDNSYTTLEKYSGSYTEYVDINDDGVYSGVSE